MSNTNETGGYSDPSAQAANENERIRLKRTFRLLHKTDDLDTAIHFALGPILDIPLTEDESMLTSEDVVEIIQNLARTNLIKVPGFFKRIPFPFRILRCVMAIHNLDPIPTDFMDSFCLSIEEKSEINLYEQLWFLMIIESDVNEVSELLEQHRGRLAELKFTPRSHGSQEQRNTIASLYTPPPRESPPQHYLQQYSISARALNEIGAQAQSNHQYV